MTQVPYTSTSLNKKKYLDFGFLRHSLINTPSPTNARPGAHNVFLC